jgi:hypothetical protein
MKKTKQPGRGTRVGFTRDELINFRAALLVLMTESENGLELAQRTVQRTNGEFGREQLLYWQHYVKALRHASHRIGRTFKLETFAKAVEILTRPTPTPEPTEG